MNTITLYKFLRTIPIARDESPNDHSNLSIDESNNYNDHYVVSSQI